jgi:hypothetical protein
MIVLKAWYCSSSTPPGAIRAARSARFMAIIETDRDGNSIPVNLEDPDRAAARRHVPAAGGAVTGLPRVFRWTAARYKTGIYRGRITFYWAQEEPAIARAWRPVIRHPGRPTSRSMDRRDPHVHNHRAAHPRIWP